MSFRFVAVFFALVVVHSSHLVLAPRLRRTFDELGGGLIPMIWEAHVWVSSGQLPPLNQ